MLLDYVLTVVNRFFWKAEFTLLDPNLIKARTVDSRNYLNITWQSEVAQKFSNSSMPVPTAENQIHWYLTVWKGLQSNFLRGGAKILFLSEGLYPIKGFCKIHIKHRVDGCVIVWGSPEKSEADYSANQLCTRCKQDIDPKHTRKSFSEHQVKFQT